MARKTWAMLAAICALLAAGERVRAAEPVAILTGGTSGVYYPLGLALAKIYTDKIPDVQPAVQATRGSVENLMLLQQGKGDIAFTQADTLARAWAGNAEAGFKSKYGKLRAVAGIYPNFIQIVATRDSNITTLADLRGKRVSVGAQKSGTELNARAILEAAGLTYADLGKVEYLPFAESVDLMKKGGLDVTLQSAGLGVASIEDLAGAMPVTLVEVPADVVARIGPPYQLGVIPANTYPGQKLPIATAAIQNFLVTQSEVNDDLIYEMTKAMFDSLPELAAAHPVARAIRLDTAAKGAPVPLHPGALRFYKERGIGF